MPFRLNARKVFLTYAQAEPVTKLALFNWLKGRSVSNRTPVKVLVAQEQHADGGLHFHCFVEFDGPINTRNAREFDYEGKHPNVQSGRIGHVGYCCKEDREPLSHPVGWHTMHLKKAKIDEAYHAMRDRLEAGDDVSAVLAAGTDKDASLIKSYVNVVKWAEDLIAIRDDVARASVHVPLYPLDDFRLAGTDYERVRAFGRHVRDMRRGDRVGVRSLWLVGASRLGKTALCRSVGDHWYMSGMWSLDAYNDGDGLYGVIDDWEWDQLKRYYKGLLGVQSDITVTDKYRKKKVIKHGYPVFVLSNELPAFSDAERAWLRVNVDFFQVVDSMVPVEEDDEEAVPWVRLEL